MVWTEHCKSHKEMNINCPERLQGSWILGVIGGEATDGCYSRRNFNLILG